MRDKNETGGQHINHWHAEGEGEIWSTPPNRPHPMRVIKIGGNEYYKTNVTIVFIWGGVYTIW